MKLKFSIAYSTAWGENVTIILRVRHADGTLAERLLTMTTTDGEHWALETTLHESRRAAPQTITYQYIITATDGRVLRREWAGAWRSIPPHPSSTFILPDAWRDTPPQHHLYTRAYAVTTAQHSSLTSSTCLSLESPSKLDFPRLTGAFFIDFVDPAHARKSERARLSSLNRSVLHSSLKINIYRRTLIVRVAAPQIGARQSIALVGSHPAIGGWNAQRFLPLHRTEGALWELSINMMGITTDVEYKFVVIDDGRREVARWEEGENRSVAAHTIGDGEALIADGGLLRTREDVWRAAGVVVPLFALRSEHSLGVGDMGDLKRFIAWAAAAGMKVIQLLPINDTAVDDTWSESCPYNPISAFAIHPQYVDIAAAGPIRDEVVRQYVAEHGAALEALPTTDYVAVQHLKRIALMQLFEEQWEEVSASEEYATFTEQNAYWLSDYTAFKVRAEGVAEAVREPMRRYHAFVQFLLHRQLSEASDYAHSLGIALKGDITMGVAAVSADTAAHPQLFNRATAGLPPNEHSAEGTAWGLPTMNRNVAAADDYAWWRARLEHMERTFDAVRIDHVLAFFRVWEVPEGAVRGTLGHYYPSLPLSVSEIEHAGFAFDPELHARPIIDDATLSNLFGRHADYVRRIFLNRHDYGVYTLKSRFTTETAIRAAFEGRNDAHSRTIREGLFALIANVLFVEDHHHPGFYHPRINAHLTAAFRTLGEEQRAAFTALSDSYFSGRHEGWWTDGAQRALATALHDSRMLICAEDLGQLPSSVSRVLESLAICSLEVQALPKSDKVEFGVLTDYPYRAVATTTTHDMPPLRLWWEEDADRAQRFFTTILHKEGVAPQQLTPALAEEIVARHLACPAMLTIIPLQDWLATDGHLRSATASEERINNPADSYNRWCYRMPLTIEALAAATPFTDKLRTMITRSRR